MRFQNFIFTFLDKCQRRLRWCRWLNRLSWSSLWVYCSTRTHRKERVMLRRPPLPVPLPWNRNRTIPLASSNRIARFKNLNNCWNANIYCYLERSGGQSSNLVLNIVNFSTPVLIRHLWQLKTVVFLNRCLIPAILIEPAQGLI